MVPLELAQFGRLSDAVVGDDPHRRWVELVDDLAEKVDVDLVEVGRPGSPGLDVAGGGCPRIALDWDGRPRSTYHAELLGCACVLPIGVGGRELVRTIERVRLGLVKYQSWTDPTSTTDNGSGWVLSAREAAILSRICDGKPNSQIADELFLSPNTVKTYVRSAYRKMGVSSRSQAVLWGLDNGY